MLSLTYHSIDHDCLVASIKVPAVSIADTSIMTREKVLILPLFVVHHVRKRGVNLVEEYIDDFFIGQVAAPRNHPLWKEGPGKVDERLSSVRSLRPRQAKSDGC